jgi:hypothetical protein
LAGSNDKYPADNLENIVALSKRIVEIAKGFLVE